MRTLGLEQLEPRTLLSSTIQLDFGPDGSAVREDMELVTAADPRFVTPVNDADRETAWSEWARDFIWAPGSFHWAQPIQNGVYHVTYGFGDNLTARTQSVTIEGQWVETVIQPKWDWHVHTAEVTVIDGTLDLLWESPTYSLLNYLRIELVRPLPDPIPVLTEAPTWATWLPASNQPAAPAEITILNGPPSTWGDSRFDESQVHRATIFADGIEWRIGRGSQIYSIRDYGLELMANQRYGFAEWVDAAIQSVVVDLDTDDQSTHETTHHIHQAGDYKLTDDPTYYSPILAEAWVPSDSAYYSVVWAQLAHIPNIHASHALIYQRLRYVGNGFLEATYGFQNFGTEVTYDFLTSPWAPIRTSSLPFQHLAQDGLIVRQFGEWPDNPRVAAADTDGFALHGRWSVPYEHLRGMALVFGQEPDVYYRWGYVADPAQDLTVQSLQRYVSIPPGQSYWTRCYVGVGDYGDLRHKALDLVESARSGPATAPPAAFEYQNDQGTWEPIADPNNATTAPYQDGVLFRLRGAEQ